jgi:hypothetical protein
LKLLEEQSKPHARKRGETWGHFLPSKRSSTSMAF